MQNVICRVDGYEVGDGLLTTRSAGFVRLSRDRTEECLAMESLGYESRVY